MINKKPTQFEISYAGEVVTVKPGISKARMCIYYLGKNRNGGFITEQFSQLLDESIAYTPVVGIYSELDGDFKGHSEDRNEARIYGLVPEFPNLGWIQKEDPDGVVRTYRTADVYLYTGRLDAAKLIPTLPQSMELNRDDLDGEWEVIDGEPFFVYTKGRYDGFSVLGKNVEPCFEGARFFQSNQKEDFYDFLIKFSNYMNKGEENMENQNLEQDGLETQNVATEESSVTEEPVTQVSEETQSEEGSVLTGEELEAYSKIVESHGSLTTFLEKFEKNESDFLELSTTYSTLIAERDNIKTEYENLIQDFSNMKEKLTQSERKEKKRLCEKYSSLLSENELNEISQKMDEYSVEEFEKELVYSCRENLFSPAKVTVTSCYNRNDSLSAKLKQELEAARNQNNNY